jgi:hypothetical protein
MCISVLTQREPACLLNYLGSDTLSWLSYQHLSGRNDELRQKVIQSELGKKVAVDIEDRRNRRDVCGYIALTCQVCCHSSFGGFKSASI